MLYFKQEITEHIKRNGVLRENRKAAYALILGQCSDLLVSKIEADAKYGDFNDNQDPVGLIQ